jgi:hypothetical protein
MQKCTNDDRRPQISLAHRKRCDANPKALMEVITKNSPKC